MLIYAFVCISIFNFYNIFFFCSHMSFLLLIFLCKKKTRKIIKEKQKTMPHVCPSSHYDIYFFKAAIIEIMIISHVLSFVA